MVSMRLLVVLVLLGCSWSFPRSIVAQPALARASAALAQRDYRQAASHYAQLEQAGYAGADLHYNWGYCLHRLGDLGGAVYHYELALLADPRHPGARNNLAEAQTRLMDQIDETMELQWSDWLIHPEWWLSLRQWQLAGLTTWILGWLLWGLAYWQPTWPYRGWLRGCGWLLLFMGMMGLGGAVLTHRNLFRRPAGVILVAEKKLQAAPEAASKIRRTLHAGTKVWQEDHLQGWSQVRLSNGDTGWLETTGIGWIR